MLKALPLVISDLKVRTPDISHEDLDIMPERTIPSSGEALPIVGCGTYRGFDVRSDGSDFEQVSEVVDILLDAGPCLIDSSPMYGRAEAVTGEILNQLDRRKDAFLATKVWTEGKAKGVAQMERSLSLLQTDRVDLMQVHNLVDIDTHLDTLAGWKAEGRTRYVGVTHYNSFAFPQVEAAMRRHRLDFLQINYSLSDRDAEERLLPLARDLGIAVIANVPFGGGALVRSLRDEPLPAFAAAIGCGTWSQMMLKFVLGHPDVTCAVPGTGNPSHRGDNLAAAHGDLADARARVLAWWQGR